MREFDGALGIEEQAELWLAPDNPALGVPRGALALRAANIAALEGRAGEARAHAESACGSAGAAAAALPEKSTERHRVDTIRSK